MHNQVKSNHAVTGYSTLQPQNLPESLPLLESDRLLLRLSPEGPVDGALELLPAFSNLQPLPSMYPMFPMTLLNQSQDAFFWTLI